MERSNNHKPEGGRTRFFESRRPKSAKFGKNRGVVGGCGGLPGMLLRYFQPHYGYGKGVS